MAKSQSELRASEPLSPIVLSHVSTATAQRSADKSVRRLSHTTNCRTTALVAAMPPMAFTGSVSKVGFMNKTATVTVSRFVTHPKVGKVCLALYSVHVSSSRCIQRLERTKKYLTHDEKNGALVHLLVSRKLRLTDPARAPPR